MKISTKFIVFILCISALCLTQCEENLQTPATISEFPPVIFNIITQQQLESFRKAGMPLVEGNRARIIANFGGQTPIGINFLIEHQCVSDNVTAANVDSAFSSYNENLLVLQDINDDAAVSASYVSARDEGSGTGFASGDGNNNFSLFFKANGVTSGISYTAIWVVTGSLKFSSPETISGLSNIHDAFLITQKGDDPLNKVADVGTIRVFRDPDSLSAIAIQKGPIVINMNDDKKNVIGH